MKKLSKRTTNLLNFFINNKEFNYISLSRNDVYILFNYYKNALNEINKLDNEIIKKEKEIELIRGKNE